ncbi:MAG: class IV adenylate cyclase [Methanoregulaceae archaeon]
MIEIELKVRVPDLAPVRARLGTLGAERLEVTRERDVYYNAPHRDFGETDEALRVRYAGARVIITYKGPKMREFGLKAREEFNTTVESGEEFEKMLDRLGFRKTIEVCKDREYFRFSGAVISLDNVEGLGTFAEIEYAGSDKNSAERVITEIAQKIGVEGMPLLESYLELLLSKQSGARR